MLGKQQPEPWQQSLRVINQCPICKASYDNGATRLFLDKNGVHLIHASCDQCGGYLMAVVMMANGSVGTVGMMTDLSFQDTERLYGASPISVDEVIEGHCWLAEKDWQKVLTKK